jgi:hypothetical protein
MAAVAHRPSRIFNDVGKRFHEGPKTALAAHRSGPRVVDAKAQLRRCADAGAAIRSERLLGDIAEEALKFLLKRWARNEVDLLLSQTR